jgi:hypothetical protein
MKKILRLVTTSVLTLTLVACGEASSSVSNGTNTSSSVATSTSAFANVTSVTLSAASDGLTQVVGSLKPVTVTAALNANTNPSTTIKWFVNGVQQSATGRTLTFTPTNAGTFNVTATVGDVMSNVLPVTVASGVNVTSATFDSRARILVVGDAGANVTLTGATMAETSRYDLKTRTYVIDLVNAVAQGSTVTVRLEREGGAPTTRQVTYDTRKLELEYFSVTYPEYSGNATEAIDDLRPVNGLYEVELPGDGVGNKTYGLSFKSSNIVLTGANAVNVKLVTKVPAGATAIPTTEFTTTEEEQDFTFILTDETVPGVYEHTLTMDTKVVTVRVNVKPAKKDSLELVTINQDFGNIYAAAYETDFREDISDLTDIESVIIDEEYILDYLNQPSFRLYKLDDEDPDFDLSGADDSDGDTVPDGLIDIVKPDANGVFVVEKPSSGELNVIQIAFDFFATGFAYDPLTGLENVLGLSLTGPSALLGNTQLFEGIEVNDTEAATNNEEALTFLSALNTFADLHDEDDTLLNDLIHTVPWLNVDEHVLGTVVQNIDAGTPAGDYVFTVSAGGLGSQKELTVKVKVVEPTPKIHFLFNDLTYNAGGITRLSRLEMVNNTLTIEKPTIPGITQEFSWAIAVENYESNEATIEEQIADSLVQTISSRKTFTTNGDELELVANDYVFTLGEETIDINEYTGDLTGSYDIIDSLDSDLFYKFVDLQVTYSGLNLDSDYSMPRDRQAILRAERAFTNSALIKNIDETELERLENIYVDLIGNISTEGMQKIELLSYDPSLIMIQENVGNDAFEIDSTTPTGTLTVNVKVDGLTEVFTIRVVEPQLKMLIGHTDQADVPYDLSLYAIDENLGFYYDEFINEPNTNNFVITLSDLAAATEGAANVLDGAFDDINFITVLDLKPGNYNWSVSRKYPNGSTYTASDSIIIEATDIDTRNFMDLLSMDGQDLKRQKLFDNFQLFNLGVNATETLQLGMHEFEFRFGPVTRKITIEIIEDPALIVNWIQIGNVVLHSGEVTNAFIVDPNLFTNITDMPVYVNYSFNDSLTKLQLANSTWEMYDYYVAKTNLEFDESAKVYDDDEGDYITFSDFESNTIMIGTLNYVNSQELDQYDFQNEDGETLFIEFKIDADFEVINNFEFTTSNDLEAYYSAFVIDFVNKQVALHRSI